MSETKKNNEMVIGTGETTVILAHGIFGSGRNWRSFLRKVANERHDLRFITYDLRNHGAAAPRGGPHTIGSCVEDLMEIAEEYGPVSSIIGHSFGGKVALAWAHQTSTNSWILDSPPSARPDQNSMPQHVLEVFRSAPTPAESRQQVREHLEDSGLPSAIVNWLLTSVRKHPDGLWRWVYNIDGLQQMLESYFHTDLWHALETPTAHHQLVVGTQSDRWTEDELQRLLTLPSAIHYLDAGHWVHVDQPKQLAQMLIRGL